MLIDKLKDKIAQINVEMDRLIFIMRSRGMLNSAGLTTEERMAQELESSRLAEDYQLKSDLRLHLRKLLIEEEKKLLCAELEESKPPLPIGKYDFIDGCKELAKKYDMRFRYEVCYRALGYSAVFFLEGEEGIIHQAWDSDSKCALPFHAAAEIFEEKLRAYRGTTGRVND